MFDVVSGVSPLGDPLDPVNFDFAKRPDHAWVKILSMCKTNQWILM